jgi:hypothetical protein
VKDGHGDDVDAVASRLIRPSIVNPRSTTVAPVALTVTASPAEGGWMNARTPGGASMITDCVIVTGP